jgi:hypothetical protein
MNIKRPLVPSFIQKLDDRLLRNKPTTWAARTHLVVYFAVLFALVLTGFCFLVFFDAKQYSNLGGWNTFIGLIAFIGFVFWLIFLLRFNVFKRYGNWFVWDGLKSFILYFISIGAMVAVCFIPSAVETFRANQQYGNDEIVNDINEINTNVCKLEYGMLPLQWDDDTCRLVNRPLPAPPVEMQDMVDTVISEIVYVDRPSFQYVDTAELRRKFNETDSVVKITDSLYVFFKCPDYVFVGSYSGDIHSAKKVLSSADMYRTIIRNYQKPDRAALLKRMEAFKIKYASSRRYTYSDYDGTYNENDSYEVKIKKKYGLYSINYGIDNIVQKKYAWLEDWDIYLRVFYYITLGLTLLVFIFRHSTVKTFFLGVLTAVVLVIFTALMMVMSNGEETAVLSFMIVYYVLFAGIALSIYGATIRRAVQGIALNLFLFMTPFVPLVFVALNEAMKYRRYYEPGYNNQITTAPDNTALYFLIAEIAGSLILLILLEPLFRKLYRKWYAAPEE